MRSQSRRWLAGTALAAAAVLAAAPERETPLAKPAIPEADRVRLAEAFRLAEELGDAIWPGWSRVPFAVVLVTPETEFFLRHPRPPSDAQPIGKDALLGSQVYVRPRTFPANLLASFPIEGVPTVVVGQAETTAASSPTDWVVTLLHEHFHQLQDSQPGFSAKVAALGLARGDTTGMCMLDYPFPYERPAVAGAHRRAALALQDALSGRDAATFRPANASFRAGLSGDDLKYFDFQLWKEGVARWTQLRVARWAAERHAPNHAFAALPGFVPFPELARALSDGISKELAERTLPEARRTVVYAFGAGQALLLDRERPCWREQYFSKMFSLEPYFAAEDCGRAAAGRG